MKLLYYSSASFADCDFPLVKALQEKGVDVTYVIELTPYNLRSTLFDIKEMLPVNDIIPALSYESLKRYASYMDMSKVYILNNTSKKQSSITTLKLMRKVKGLIKKEGFDVLHSDTIFSMQHLWLLFWGNWILTMHDPFPHTGENSRRRMMEYYVNIKKAKGLVLLNNNQKDAFCKKYNRLFEDVLINSLGAYDNIRVFCKGGQATGMKNVLFFGRISQYKGVEYLCEAMIKVKKAVQDATLTIAGGGKIYFDISKYESMSWIEIRNRFIGIEELAELIENCAISVCPYTDATQSGVVMTCFGLNKPVVVTNTGGLPEQVEDGKTGFVVEPCNVEQLAEKIVMLLKNDGLRDSMSKNIHDLYFDGEKSWSSIADKYIGFYKTMISL